nr:ornithine carbamoyltransferase [Actinomycetota bacterium]
MRTFAHERLTTLASAASVPVLNALTDQEHPCQALADLLTIKDHFGAFEGVRLAFIGPANNVTNSLILAAASVGMSLVVGCPEGSEPSEAILSEAARISATEIEVVNGAPSAVLGADVVYADTWASMGDGTTPEEAAQRCAAFQVNETLMEQVSERAIFMHCLPAHRGSEVTSEVLDGPRSVVWQQAENRLHVQKALLRWMMREAH